MMAQILMLSFPFMLFSFTWFNDTVQLVILQFTILLILCYIYIYIPKTNEITVQLRLLVVVSTISFLWIYFSGIGGFSRQVDDYWVRDPIYNDLIQMDWPMVYDLQKQSESIQNVLGTDKVYMVYYLMFWVVPSFISKILGQTSGYTIISNLVLFIWSYLYIILVMLNLITWFKHQITGNEHKDRRILIALIIFIFFGGLDIIFNIGESADILESWASGLRYVGNTSQLYWTFNQQLPVWLICQILINSSQQFVIMNVWIYSLIVWYSPWAQIGLIPLVIVRILDNPRKLIETLKYKVNRRIILLNAMFILIEAFVSIQYYTQNDKNLSCAYFIFSIEDTQSEQIAQLVQMLIIYQVFMLIEVAFMLIFMKGQQCYRCYNSSRALYIVVILQLFLIPMFHVSLNNDFCMRVSLPSLFYMSLYWALFVVNELKDRKNSIKILVVIMLIIQLSGQFKLVMTNAIDRDFNNDEILHVGRSFQNMNESSTVESLRLLDQQFFSHEFENTLYYKYISNK